MRIGKVRIECDRPVEARKCLVKTMQLGERRAAMVECLEEIRFERKCPVEMEERILIASELVQREAVIVEQFGMVGGACKRLPDILKRLVGALQA